MSDIVRVPARQRATGRRSSCAAKAREVTADVLADILTTSFAANREGVGSGPSRGAGSRRVEVTSHIVTLCRLRDLVTTYLRHRRFTSMSQHSVRTHLISIGPCPPPMTCANPLNCAGRPIPAIAPPIPAPSPPPSPPAPPPPPPKPPPPAFHPPPSPLPSALLAVFCNRGPGRVGCCVKFMVDVLVSVSSARVCSESEGGASWAGGLSAGVGAVSAVVDAGWGTGSDAKVSLLLCGAVYSSTGPFSASIGAGRAGGFQSSRGIGW